MALDIVKSHGFRPVARADARVLILGTLPGKVSLESGQYFANPRNAFWRIMGELFGAFPDLPYEERLCLLKVKGIALWDVCAAACGLGSLDSAIQVSTLEANDIGRFLRTHTRIGLICFNGKKAEEIYNKKVLPNLPSDVCGRINNQVLPSTAAANARMPFDQKLAIWRSVLCNETSN